MTTSVVPRNDIEFDIQRGEDHEIWTGRFEFFLSNSEEAPDPNNWATGVSDLINDETPGEKGRRSMAGEQRTGQLPSGLSKPAQRALAGAGIERLEDLTRFRESDVAQLHGMGPKGIRQLREALSEAGLSFSSPGR